MGDETDDGAGIEDVAWDSVAVEPLPAKPDDIVVTLGDSYSSGEGVSQQSNPSDYYKESDVDGPGGAPWRDACHRSPNTWSRQMRLADDADNVRGRDDHWDPTLDYHLIACSGAVTANVLPWDVGDVAGGASEYSELPQLNQGYLDVNTTLVTISIGGNDARFSDIVKQCIYGSPPLLCQDATIGNDTESLGDSEPKLIRGHVRDSIKSVLTEIHLQAPNANIVLMGYPILLENDGQCIIGINQLEGQWMDQMAGLLDDQMSGVATEETAAGVPTWFADPRTYFAGQGICGSPETIHEVVAAQTPGDTGKPVLGIPGLPAISDQSFHPTVAGATNYANSANATLRAMGQ